MQIGLSGFLRSTSAPVVTGVSIAVTSAKNRTSPDAAPTDVTDTASAIYHPGESAEEKYRLSTQTLQLLKRYDVRDIHMSDLTKLTSLMEANNEASGEEASAMFNAQDLAGIGSKANAIEVLQKQNNKEKAMLANGTIDQLSSYNGDGQLNAVGIAALQRMAAIHDALKTDDSVQMAAEGTVTQAWNNSVLESWIRHNTNGSFEVTADAIFAQISSALTHLGVTSTAMPVDASDEAQQAQAWKDYQAWQKQHPDAEIKIDLTLKDKTEDTQQPSIKTSEVKQSKVMTVTQQTKDPAADELETKYGYSLRTLQLLKGNDVRQMSNEQLNQLTQLMQARGELTQQQVDELQPGLQKTSSRTVDYFSKDVQFLSNGMAAGRPDLQAMLQLDAAGKHEPNNDYNVLRRDDGRPVLNAKEVLRRDQQSLALLNKLADLHDTLQNDAQVQAQGAEGLQQQTSQDTFDTWVDWHRSDPAAQNATASYRTQSDVTSILNTLQSMGVTLSKTTKNATSSQQLASAWQDYQHWQTAQPSTKSQASGPQVDTYA